MQLLTPAGDLDAFFARVRRVRHRVLLLDYDGTLAPFTIDRAQAVPYHGVTDILASLLRLTNCRTAIISGRAVADVAGLLGLRPLPEIWGSHGWEHLAADGAYTLLPLDEASRAALRCAADMLDALNLPNLREDKPVGVAAHWRGLADTQAASVRRSLLPAWTRLAERTSLRVHPFDGGLELRAAGRDKGSVVTEIVTATGPDAAVAYLGDDLTDEDAFRALHGRGLRVLVRPTLRDTLADLWLQPPRELIDFMTEWLHAGEQAIG